MTKDHHSEDVVNELGVKSELNKNKRNYAENKRVVENLIDDSGGGGGGGGGGVGVGNKPRENIGVEYIPEFGASKLDPKYQTLPYNTKFGINQHKNIGHQSVGDVTTIENNNDGLYERNTGIVNPVGQQQQQPQQQPPLMTVHNPHILPPNLNNINRIPNHLNPR